MCEAKQVTRRLSGVQCYAQTGNRRHAYKYRFDLRYGEFCRYLC
jgi:hypothetical protein